MKLIKKLSPGMGIIEGWINATNDEGIHKGFSFYIQEHVSIFEVKVWKDDDLEIKQVHCVTSPGYPKSMRTMENSLKNNLNNNHLLDLLHACNLVEADHIAKNLQNGIS